MEERKRLKMLSSHLAEKIRKGLLKKILRHSLEMLPILSLTVLKVFCVYEDVFDSRLRFLRASNRPFRPGLIVSINSIVSFVRELEF